MIQFLELRIMIDNKMTMMKFMELFLSQLLRFNYFVMKCIGNIGNYYCSVLKQDQADLQQVFLELARIMMEINCFLEIYFIIQSIYQQLLQRLNGFLVFTVLTGIYLIITHALIRMMTMLNSTYIYFFVLLMKSCKTKSSTNSFYNI